MMYIPRFQGIEDLKTDIAHRLRPVCSHFPEEEFTELIDQIARIEYKYAQRAAEIVPRGHFFERPIVTRPNAAEESPETQSEPRLDVSFEDRDTADAP
jgi:hypothetical protein